jgi:predicted amidophosphoribosyltransferase
MRGFLNAHPSTLIRFLQFGVIMKCGYCGFEFPEEEGIKGCGKCGKPGRCHNVRCPRCFYENPPELKILNSLKKLIKNRS